MRLERRPGRPLLIGHRGAKAVAPENTLAGLEAAVAAGVDVVELDISPGLRVAHDPDDADDKTLTLDEALAFLAKHGVGAHLDVKLPGYERDVIAAVDRRAVRELVYVSTAFATVARRVAALAPDLTVAIGYPRDRLGVSRLAWPEPVTRASAALLRQAMPARIPLLLWAARANALALHHALCSRAAVATAHRLGVPVLVWTVNDAASAQRFTALGVDGIVSDDPGSLRATLPVP
ncbi:MAG TPA: glycerophosphodiester phosphodiesterase [Gaiellaceae bacterium]|nr:glycerophosphodiester phosphodiesterase [Gaiellaceae bacterium]